MAQSGQLSEVGAYLPELLNNPEGDAREICEAYVNGFCINLQFDLANSLIDAWQADFPADAETYIRRGFIHQTMREWSSAVEEYRRGLERQPGRADVRIRMGQCLLEMGAADEAAREFRASAKIDPESSAARKGLAKALVELKQYDEAEAILQSLLAKETCRVEARRGLGRISLLKKEPERAASWLEPLVDEWPCDASARYLLAQAYRETGQFDRAQTHFRALREFEEPLRRLKELYELVPANPEDIDLRFELGKLLLQYESREEGAAYLQSVLRLAPEHREAHELLADYYSRSGDRRLALVHRRLAHAQSSDGT